MTDYDDSVPFRMTPMMKQYMEAKETCPDAILLFRMGDFYEMFYDDARLGARILSLALTSREKGENPMPMAGFPHLQLEAYVGKLITSGYRVAVCDQTEDPKLAKGIVKREVTRVVTPGTLTEDILLNPREANYLTGIVLDDTLVGIAWVDLSTGKFSAAGFPRARLLDQLARIAPSECLACEGDELPQWLTDRMMLTRRPVWAAGLTYAEKTLTTHFNVLKLDGFGFNIHNEIDRPAIRAAGLVLDYLRDTQKASLEHIDILTAYHSGDALEIDESSRRSLEITRTLREGRRDGSLLAVLDIAVTSMGSRLLGEWIANPLTSLKRIELRQDAVAELMSNSNAVIELRKTLRGIYDLERLLSRVTTSRANPRDLSAIGATLRTLPQVRDLIEKCKAPLLYRIWTEIDCCPELTKTLGEALIDSPPLQIMEGGLIRPGYNAQLDELREIAHGGRQWISKYQAEEQERSGISNLKVGYNKVFGFYIEVNHSQAEKVPDYFIRKQTIKNAERYITPQLKEYEEVVLSADEKQKELEYKLFLELRELTLQYRRRMKGTASVLAELDVLLAFAEQARTRNYCRPVMTENPELEILDGRHPVLDSVAANGAFVPNDVICNDEQGKILLITGPNMSGKSTYIRQVALLTLMAQIGSFIPAREAKIGLVDKIFARVGASDELARGQSTFMVEMTEAARILNLATPSSLVILDEIGRGTSTYDGISLAWAIIEHLHERIECRTLFATHYHELTDMSTRFKKIRNLNVAVQEWQGDVVFLHKIIEGATDRSYGIHVARLAGVPVEVLARANDILEQMEERHSASAGLEAAKSPRIKPKKPDGPATRVRDVQLLLFDPKENPVLDEIRKIDLNALTPLQCLLQIQQWKSDLEHPKDEN